MAKKRQDDPKAKPCYQQYREIICELQVINTQPCEVVTLDRGSGGQVVKRVDGYMQNQEVEEYSVALLFK